MKKNLPITMLCLMGIFLGSLAHAQDPIFNQFYAAPLQTNPALTGVFDGRFRVHANYKQQWNSILDKDPFKTVAVGFDMRHRIGRGDFFSWGVTALRDEAGISQFTRNTGGLNFSYMKQLSGGSRYRSFDQYLVGGVQAAFGQMTLDPDNLWFSTQFDLTTETINPGLDPNINMLIDDASDPYMDLSAGLMWYAVFEDNKSLYFGGALFHANSPSINFFQDDEEVIETRWMGQFGGELPLTNQLSVLPAVILTTQGASLLSIFGANFRYTNRDWREVAIRAGTWVHLSRDELNGISMPTVSVAAILEMDRVNIGISYDINSNKLTNPTNGRGGFELSMIYIQPATRKERVACPKM